MRILDFEAADSILEEQREGPEVGVCVDAGARVVLQLRGGEGGVVQEAQLEEGLGVRGGEAWGGDLQGDAEGVEDAVDEGRAGGEEGF